MRRLDRHRQGSVNHYDFADPVGWYQTSANLKLPVVTVTDGETTGNSNVVLYQPVPFGDEEQSVAYGNGGGTLKKLRGNHALHIWGTPDERGYAIGLRWIHTGERHVIPCS
ncbi:MAG: hypothetical protein B6240_00220 [Desulfobacteraceae bacterium 4572_87]|nr:MAG: hypothetical protein B6240_00220 [Desulfobacteraceae bacterium 4572_87]